MYVESFSTAAVRRVSLASRPTQRAIAAGRRATPSLSRAELRRIIADMVD